MMAAPRPLEERFWEKVRKGPQCWEWTGSRVRGYGYFGAWGRVRLAHRVSWQLRHGEIPPGLCILHRCDNPSCVRPGHLFIGTQRDNMQDAKRKGRTWQSRVTHCAHGHPFSGDNLYLPPSGRQRICRICRKRYRDEYRRRIAPSPHSHTH